MVRRARTPIQPRFFGLDQRQNAGRGGEPNLAKERDTRRRAAGDGPVL
jgi:hypothetical protein